VTGIAYPSASYCVAVDSGGGISVGEVLPSQGQIERQLRRHLAPIGSDARIGHLLTHGGCRIAFDAPSAGLLKISWYQPSNGHHRAKPTLVAAGHATSTPRGMITLELRLTRHGRQLLKTVARIKLISEGAFTPAGNQPINARTNLSLHH